MFDRKGQLLIEGSAGDEDKLLELALEAGAEDFQREDDNFIVTTEPTQLHSVRSALEAKGVKVAESEIAMIPKNTVKVDGKEAESVLKLIEALEDLDDVQKVHANFDIDVADMARV
jgi:transcriptional/translational regulatory protein YebC/TACO1